MKKRMTMFRIAFIAIVALVYYYLGYRLTSFSDVSSWATYSIWSWLFLLFAFFLFLPFYFWHPHEKELSTRMKQMMILSHRVLAYLNFLVPIVLIRDLAGFMSWILLDLDMSWIYGGSASAVLLVLPLALKAWGEFRVVRGPQVIRKEIEDSRLPVEFSGLRILQISDLHISHFLKTGFVDQVVKLTSQLKPDLTVLTGDIVDGPAAEHAQEIAKLKGLQSKFGNYFVPGNHEYYWGFSEIQKSLSETGIVPLINSAHRITGEQGELLVAGVTDPAAVHFGGEGPKLAKIPTSEAGGRQFRILLAHQPHLADAAAEHDFHLQLSGHTHGGQFFPWNLFIGFFQKYPKGLFRIKNMNLYVSQGTGYWGPAVRIGTHCELTEITLKSKPPES